MEEILKLDPIMKVGGSVDLPGSKSISNRALLLAALSEGTTELNNLLVAEDTGDARCQTRSFQRRHRSESGRLRRQLPCEEG